MLEHRDSWFSGECWYVRCSLEQVDHDLLQSGDCSGILNANVQLVLERPIPQEESPQ